MGSHGQRHLLAVGFSLSTTHDHRKGDGGPPRGDRGYHYPDIKGKPSQSVNAISAVTARGEFWFEIYPPPAQCRGVC